MSEPTHPDGISDVPWPTSGPRVRVPDTSMLPGSEKTPPAAVNLLNHAVQGAHRTIDHLADRAVPVARQLGESASAAEAALQTKTDQLRGTRDEWAESLRTKVRSKPLVSIAVAIALGAVIARLSRQ